MRMRAALVAIATLALVASAGGAPALDPGLTPTSILLGGTVPLSGEAAALPLSPPVRRRTSTT